MNRIIVRHLYASYQLLHIHMSLIIHFLDESQQVNLNWLADECLCYLFGFLLLLDVMINCEGGDVWYICLYSPVLKLE